MECQIDYTQIGTQTLQKRKSWGARTWELVGTEFPRLQILRGNWPPLTGPTHIWVGSPRSGQNWGSPNGAATRVISSDFPGMARASSDLGITALVSQKKVERWCLFWGGPIFEKNGHGVVHFGRGARSRFCCGNLIFLDILEIHVVFSVFIQNPVIFLIPIGFCGHFPAKCYSWAQTLNFRVPFFSMSSAGAKRSKNTPF